MLATGIFYSIQSATANSEVTILSHSSYVSSLGYYYIVGEILNNGSQPIKYVKIIATYYNSSGVVVAVDFTYTELDVIHPNQKSPFKIILIDEQQVAKVDHYSLSTSYSYADELPAKLKILSNSSYIGSSGYLYVVGEIENTGNETANFTKVTATFYALNGTVVATDFTYTEPYDIAPSQKAPFQIILIEKDRVTLVYSYELVAESNQYSLIPEKITALGIIVLLIAVGIIIITMRKHFNAA